MRGKYHTVGLQAAGRREIYDGDFAVYDHRCAAHLITAFWNRMQSRCHWNCTCHVHGLAGEGCHFCGTVPEGKVEGVSGDLKVLTGT